jgi:hypothetical protein
MPKTVRFPRGIAEGEYGFLASTQEILVTFSMFFLRYFSDEK